MFYFFTQYRQFMNSEATRIIGRILSAGAASYAVIHLALICAGDGQAQSIVDLQHALAGLHK